MDINDLKKLFDENKQQLSNILKDCQNGPSELVLLASKMGALMYDLNAMSDDLYEQIEVQEEACRHNGD